MTGSQFGKANSELERAIRNSGDECADTVVRGGDAAAGVEDGVGGG